MYDFNPVGESMSKKEAWWWAVTAIIIVVLTVALWVGCTMNKTNYPTTTGGEFESRMVVVETNNGGPAISWAIYRDTKTGREFFVTGGYGTSAVEIRADEDPRIAD